MEDAAEQARRVGERPFRRRTMGIALWTMGMALWMVTCALWLTACKGASDAVEPPAPVPPVPTAEQVAWQQMETNAFIHFGLNTFNDREWGYGDSDPQTFHPTELDCRQWVRTLQAAGMQGVILTAKHHDGFCLWPYRGTDYEVGASPYRGGQGDVLGELAAACREAGLRLGVYVSPWDRHHAEYGREGYVRDYHAQLRDVLTGYGDVFEVWLDGANGGDGWYGGARETRTIDRRTYYDFPRIYAMIDSLMPHAIVFGDGGPGCRWVGNERGEAGQTNWSLLRQGEVYPGYPHPEELATGHEDGDAWVPAECDVSIRPGWFYHPEEDDRVKSPEELLDLYYCSVGRGGLLLLNLPVDRRGRIPEKDSTHVVRFRQLLDCELQTDLLAGLRAEVSNVRGRGYGPEALTDGQYDTYWATADGVTAATATFTFDRPQLVDRLMLQEYIPLGQRVRAFAVDYLQDGTWHAVPMEEATTTIGYKRLLRFPAIVASGLRIRILDARGPVCINRIGAFYSGHCSE